MAKKNVRVFIFVSLAALGMIAPSLAETDPLARAEQDRGQWERLVFYCDGTSSSGTGQLDQKPVWVALYGISKSFRYRLEYKGPGFGKVPVDAKPVAVDFSLFSNAYFSQTETGTVLFSFADSTPVMGLSKAFSLKAESGGKPGMLRHSFGKTAFGAQLVCRFPGT